MATARAHSIDAIEHSHTHLNDLALEIRRLLRSRTPRTGRTFRERLVRLSADLRDELLEHFANEEEGLFPFVRKHVPAQTGTVDRLQAAHDAICGAIVRLAHHAAREQTVTTDALVVYERFEAAYAEHSRQETELFERLQRVLTTEEQAVLAEHLRGLA